MLEIWVQQYLLGDLRILIFFFFSFNFWLRWVLVAVHGSFFSSCGERGLLFIGVCGPLTAVASLVVEHRL